MHGDSDTRKTSPMKTRPGLAMTAALLAAIAAAHADERLPEGLKAMPDGDLDAVNGYLSSPSDRYDTPPKATRAYLPIYPASRLRAGKAGSCMVEFTIDTDGKAADPRPDPGADVKMCDHALYALRHWEFSPATKGGRPVAVRYRMPFDYDLR